MPTFDLLREPWIEVLEVDGSVRSVGIIEALMDAHKLTALQDPAPTIQFGLYRMLVAFVVDAFDLREFSDLARVLERGQFNGQDLERYADAVGRNRFDLFDGAHPFLQTPGASADPENAKSVAQLLFQLPTGTNVVHFNHVQAEEHAFAPAVCARALCALAPFATSGGRGYSPSINGTPPWYVLVVGGSLFETLLLNCFMASEFEMENGVPLWRDDSAVPPGQVRACRGLLDGLTWPVRTVRLLPGEGGECTYSGEHSPVLVREMVYGPGAKTADSHWTDPNVAYRTTDKGPQSIRPREDRQVWRDTGPLLLLRSADYENERSHVRFSRPAIINQLRVLQRDLVIAPRATEVFEVYGIRADKAKIFEWQYERLSLPRGIARNTLAGQQVQEAMDAADLVSYWLGRAVKRAYPRQGGGNDRAFGRLLQKSLFLYWSSLQTQFDELVMGLAAAGSDGDGKRADLVGTWRSSLRSEGLRALRVAIDPLDSDADALRRQQESLAEFLRGVSSLLRPAVAGAEEGRDNS